ncbi:37S ribosomal protein S24, mitochondrial [Coemansia interrupta]|uniref:37S ribosomal protein S24, mitochondrial n=1 Tax=Coemansia interrupta TaxID=1126814 RepID=A0A9W8H728_9FUNG|nr:37S ribosomal protein S24, mitochondrial [Coemansia interrupta]
MNVAVGSRLRAVLTQRTRTVNRSLHTTSIAQVGRNKRKVNFKACAIKNRKEHAEIYDEQDRAYDIETVGDWEYDDHHTYGHLLLDNVRDVRKYVRLMKFEHPTLAQYARPFRVPSSEHVLRFERSVTMGDKTQAQDRKVVLRVRVAQLGLKGPELHKFLLLVGVRYDPQTDELKMSEDREATSLLNKKRLADTLNQLIGEAKKKDDMFGDVALDFTHRKYKHKMAFPEEWLPKTKAGEKL